MQRRFPAVAGLFYPDNPDELTQMIGTFLAQPSQGAVQPKALIAPHAGYVYSGVVAASGYAQLIPYCDQITSVVLLGPSHRVPFQGLAVSSADIFVTPLGEISIDREKCNRILQLPQVKTVDAAHAQEHSLEVQLPFLQKILPEFSLVPVVVGDASPDEVADVLEVLWGGPETLIVVSSDLSHYHTYETARRLDKETSDAIVRLDPDDIGYEDACGRNSVNGLLTIARKKGMHAEILDLRNSGDTAGPRDRVVGYGAYVFH